MKSLNRLLARSLPAITLFAWSAVLLYFYFSGRLNHYLIETYRPFVLATGLVLPVVALGLLFTGRGIVSMPDDETDAMAFGVRPNAADAKLRPGQILAFLVLLLPVGAAAAVKNDSFSAKAIFNRGLVESSEGLPPSSGAVHPALVGRSSPAAPLVTAAPSPAVPRQAAPLNRRYRPPTARALQPRPPRDQTASMPRNTCASRRTARPSPRWWISFLRRTIRRCARISKARNLRWSASSCRIAAARN